MTVEMIDTRHGSWNRREFSNGNTLPYTGVPFGMNYFTVQTNEGTDWHFDPTLPIFQGVRLTHQPSPWMGDYSWLTLTPVTGEKIAPPSLELHQSSYVPERAIFRPHHLRMDVNRYRLGLDVVPTTRGASIEINPRTNEPLGILWSTEFETDYRVSGDHLHFTHHQPINDDQSVLNLYGQVSFGETADHLKLYGYDETSKEWVEAGEETLTSRHVLLRFERQSQTIRLTMGTSFLSEDYAAREEESVRNKRHDEWRAESAAKWEELLGLIEVHDHDHQKVRDFNQYLYRLFLFPMRMYEYNEQGEPVHYDFYSGEERAGKFYTNNGFWDTYKTVFPLFSIILPELYEELVKGFLTFYDESGHLPKWLSPDERGLMPGTHINAVLADAAVKGILSEEDMRRALDAMIKEATTPPENPKFGRRGVKDMQTYGYVTNDERESVNQTQDNAYSDFCISQVARILGEHEISGKFAKASLNYKHLFDEEVGFLRGRDADGNFTEDFTPEGWGGDYTEGSAWVNSLAVFHNFSDYMALMGGADAFLNHLVKLANEEPIYDIGDYGMEIHETSEMALGEFGQLAISNQPSFHIPYLYTYAGRPEYTQLLVKEICEHLFTTDFDGYPGDEDNGSMSGWYVFSHLGFYPVTPGTNQYVLGISQFDEMKIHLPNDKTFEIITHNRRPQNHFVEKVALNGEDYDKLYLEHEDIISGGTLESRHVLLPQPRTYEKEQLPYSLNNELKDLIQ